MEVVDEDASFVRFSIECNNRTIACRVATEEDKKAWTKAFQKVVNQTTADH